MKLKNVFHEQGVGGINVPVAGFSEMEDPLSLAGFLPVAERKSKTQAHTFGFSFPDPSNPPSASLPADDTGVKKAVTALGHNDEADLLPRAARLALWADPGRLGRAARKMLTAEGGEGTGKAGAAAAGVWHEHRRSLLRDAKRRVRYLPRNW